MDTGTVYLKVKLKSLAEEARIIRREEVRRRAPRRKTFQARYGEQWLEPYTEAIARWRADARVQRERHELYHHRVDDVRSEARHTLIAYAFLRGKGFDSLMGRNGLFGRGEMRSYKINWKRVFTLVERYGARSFWTKELGQTAADADVKAAQVAQMEAFRAWANDACAPHRAFFGGA